MADYEIIEAVPGQKNKASVYNTNFGRMKKYVDDSVDELTTETNNTLSVYQNVNSLATSGTIALTDNSVNSITPAGAVTFELPTITGAEVGKFHQILVQINLSTVYAIDVGTDYFFDLVAPNLEEIGLYDLIYEYDNASGNWVCGAMYKGEIE